MNYKMVILIDLNEDKKVVLVFCILYKQIMYVVLLCNDYDSFVIYRKLLVYCSKLQIFVFINFNNYNEIRLFIRSCVLI